jgi:hypothetical protein
MPPASKSAAPPATSTPANQTDAASPPSDGDGKAVHVTVNNYIDGKDVASYMIGTTTQGATGVNMAGFRITPSMGPLGMPS